MRILILLIITCSFFSCKEQTANNKENQNASTNEINNDGVNSGENLYELHGILDPGMNNMVAFALQTPAHWNMQQSFTRIWNGSTPINQVYISVASPDSKTTIEFLPYTPYYYSDGPMARQMRESAASMGIQQKLQQNEMPPMHPLEYIKRMILPQLAQRGVQIQPGGENSIDSKQMPQNTTLTTAYIDGIMSNGRKVRIDCIVSVTTTNLNGEVYYNWNANPSIVQTDDNLEAAYAFVTHARISLMSNPAWEQQNAQLVQNGNKVNNEINQKNAAIVKDYQDHTEKIINETYADRNKSEDQRSEAFSDAMSGESKYENTATGERMKLTDQYNHLYQDKQGNFYGSNTAVNANEFDWAELQRVETKKY
ncbi:MAG: hypothetical protein ABI402_17005 [Ferruginibacter sp.]